MTVRFCRDKRRNWTGIFFEVRSKDACSSAIESGSCIVSLAPKPSATEPRLFSTSQPYCGSSGQSAAAVWVRSGSACGCESLIRRTDNEQQLKSGDALTAVTQCKLHKGSQAAVEFPLQLHFINI